jgi:hypothetical protein
MRSGRTLGDVFLVRLNPIGRDLVLRGREIDLPVADQIMQSYLEHIFNVRVPGGCMVGLRPKVWYRVRTAEGKRIVPFIGGCYPVFGVRLFSKGPRHGPHLFRVPGHTDILDRDVEHIARGQLGIRQERRRLLSKSARVPDKERRD